VARCHLGLPVVIQVPPRLDDGTPFPTLYWLTCPLATTLIAQHGERDRQTVYRFDIRLQGEGETVFFDM
jgi:hypothetical protein